MKRIIALSLVCVLAIAAFCSCGQSAKKLSEVFTEIKSEAFLRFFRRRRRGVRGRRKQHRR